MKVSTGSLFRAVVRTIPAAACGLFLQACASASIDEAVPAAAGSANAVTTASGPRDTATFPNLNVPPTPAAEQISDAEKTATTRALMEARKRAITTDTPAPKNVTADLRQLARSHGKDALNEIEVAE